MSTPIKVPHMSGVDSFTPDPKFITEVDFGESVPTGNHAEVIITGGGFSGICLGGLLRRRGHRDFLIIDRNEDWGGCWLDNKYPGVACDVPSHLYSLSFELNPDWSHAYGRGAEICEYLKAAAHNEELDEHYRPSTTMEEATWDAENNLWHIQTPKGEYTCHFLVTGSGHLVDPKIPDIPGIDGFPGMILHSARWDTSMDLTGKRVAVVGTGASSIQVTPAVAPMAGQLIVFQRTPAYIMPRIDPAYSETEKKTYRRHPDEMQRERDDHFWQAEALYGAMRLIPAMQAHVKKLTLNHLESLVEDPKIRQLLTPTYTPGCKRILISDEYFKAFNRANVTLEPSALASVEGSTLVSANGERYEVDAVILCTGFAVSQPIYAAHVRNEKGETLADVWGKGGAPTHTLAQRGFPNLFTVNARNTGLGHNSSVHIIESQAAAVVQAVDYCHDTSRTVLEPTAEADKAWNDWLREWSRDTVWTSDGGCSAWYVDDRTGQLTAIWPDYAYDFRVQNGHFDPAWFDMG